MFVACLRASCQAASPVGRNWLPTDWPTSWNLTSPLVRSQRWWVGGRPPGICNGFRRLALGHIIESLLHIRSMRTGCSGSLLPVADDGEEEEEWQKEKATFFSNGTRFFNYMSFGNSLLPY